MIWVLLMILILGEVRAEPEAGRLELLENQVTHQQTWLQELQHTITLQQDFITKLTTKLQEKEADEKALKDETMKLHRIIESQDRRISDLEHTIQQYADTRDNMDTLNTESDEATTENNIQRPVMSNRKHGMVKRNVSSSSVYTMRDESVAFEATISDSKVVLYSSDRNIIFDSVTFNMGHGYNKANGVFTAPARGIYLFSTSVTLKNPSAPLHVDIEKNGVEIAGAFASSAGPADTYNQGAVTVVTFLEIGDRISVCTERHDRVSVYGDTLTSFSGLIVMPL